jgi:hypothetical protein
MARHSRIPRRGGSSHELYGLETYATAASAGAVGRAALCADLAGESLGCNSPNRKRGYQPGRSTSTVRLPSAPALVEVKQSNNDSDAVVEENHVRQPALESTL